MSIKNMIIKFSNEAVPKNSTKGLQEKCNSDARPTTFTGKSLSLNTGKYEVLNQHFITVCNEGN